MGVGALLGGRWVGRAARGEGVGSRPGLDYRTAVGGDDETEGDLSNDEEDDAED